MTLELENKEAQQVAYAALRPAARLALGAGVSLREIKKLVEIAFYQEAKTSGLKMREISDVLSVSMAKVGLLSKGLKNHFVQPDVEHGVSRKILSLLWAGPLSKSRIQQALPDFESAAVEQAIKQLIDEERVHEIDGRTPLFKLSAAAHRLDTNPWMAKIDGLNTLLEFVSRTIETRFFEDDDRANVRNLAFRVRDEDLEKIQQFYEEQLFPLIVKLDGAVEDEASSTPMKLSLLWTPDQEKLNEHE